MRILGLTVGRNESGRYLESMLQAAGETLDDLFFYDDQSTDATPVIAAQYATLETRPHQVPSFIENEGRFRYAAWEAFENAMQPTSEDWVLVLDCDEVLVGGHGLCTRHALEHVIGGSRFGVIMLNIPEIFGYEEQVPLIRTDRLWNTIHAPRLFRFRPNGRYVMGDLGVPAVPTYAMGQFEDTDFLYLMHYGYADKRDHRVKYERYRGKLGHSNAHVNSIMEIPTLEPWTGSFDTRMKRNSD